MAGSSKLIPSGRAAKRSLITPSTTRCAPGFDKLVFVIRRDIEAAFQGNHRPPVRKADRGRICVPGIGPLAAGLLRFRPTGRNPGAPATRFSWPPTPSASRLRRSTPMISTARIPFKCWPTILRSGSSGLRHGGVYLAQHAFRIRQRGSRRVPARARTVTWKGSTELTKIERDGRGSQTHGRAPGRFTR